MNAPISHSNHDGDTGFPRILHLRSLTLREQFLIAIMMVFALILGMGIFFQRLEHTEQKLGQKLSARQLQLDQIRALISEWNSLKQEPSAPVMNQALGTFIENVARSFAIQDILQLNVLPQVEEGMEGVQVRLDQLKLDQLTDMLYELENHWPMLRLSQMNISISPGNRLVRAGFQVHKQLGN